MTELSATTKIAVAAYNNIMKLINKGCDLIFYRKDNRFYAKCLRCGEWLFSVIDVKAHFLAHENKDDTVDPYENVMEKIKDDETGFMLYRCRTCKAQFIDETDAKAHIEICHRRWMYNKLERHVDEDATVIFKVKGGLPKGITIGVNGKPLKLEDGMKIKILLYIAKAMKYYGLGKVTRIEDH